MRAIFASRRAESPCKQCKTGRAGRGRPGPAPVVGQHPERQCPPAGEGLFCSCL